MRKNTNADYDPTLERRKMMQKLYDSIQRDLKAKGRSKLGQEIRSREHEGAVIRHYDSRTNLDMKILNNLLLPDIRTVEECMGPSFCASEHTGDLYQPGAVRGLEIATYVGLRAVEELNYRRDWRFWSGTPHSPEVAKAWHDTWLQTLFRICLTLPIGYIVSHTRVCEVTGGGDSSSGESWQPPVENYAPFFKRNEKAVVRRSNRTLAPRLISFSTYLRLFPRKTDESRSRNAELVPMLALAEADIFDDYPQTENPLYKALDAALQAVFTEDTMRLCLPYWWVYLINHHFVRKPGWRPINCWIDASCVPEFVETGVKYADDKDGAVSSASEKPRDSQPDSETPAPVTTAEPTTDPATDGAVRVLIHTARKAIENGEFPSNRKGASFHVYNGSPYLVNPLFFRALANKCPVPGMTADRAHSLLSEKGFLGTQFDEIIFSIFPKDASRSLGKMKTIPLFPAGIEAFFPNGMTLGDNPDLRLAKQPLRDVDATVASIGRMA